jgi:hypothetical protein
MQDVQTGWNWPISSLARRVSEDAPQRTSRPFCARENRPPRSSRAVPGRRKPPRQKFQSLPRPRPARSQNFKRLLHPRKRRSTKFQGNFPLPGSPPKELPRPRSPLVPVEPCLSTSSRRPPAATANATGSPRGSLRLLLHRVRPSSRQMPRACTVDRYAPARPARVKRYSAASKVTIHGASPWHSFCVVASRVAANVMHHGSSPWHLSGARRSGLQTCSHGDKPAW